MIEVLAFILGIHLTMALLAAGYGIIDLWYCIGEHIGWIIVRLVIVVTLTLLCYTGFEPDVRTAFAAGQGFFLAFHVAVYWIGKLLRKLA